MGHTPKSLLDFSLDFYWALQYIVCFRDLVVDLLECSEFLVFNVTQNKLYRCWRSIAAPDHFATKCVMFTRPEKACTRSKKCNLCFVSLQNISLKDFGITKIFYFLLVGRDFCLEAFRNIDV